MSTDEQFRAGFEAWARKETFSLDLDDEGFYLFSDTLAAWGAWIACKREASTEPSAEGGREGGLLERAESTETRMDSDSTGGLLVGASSIETLDEKAENALLWCYRRMKNSYGRLPFIEEAVAGLRARRAGALTDDAKNAACWQYIEEHATTHGGGHGFTITCFVPVDHEDMQCGILAAIEAQAKAGSEKGEG